MKKFFWFFLNTILKKMMFFITAKTKLEIDYEKSLEQIIAECKFDHVDYTNFSNPEPCSIPKTGKKVVIVKVFKLRDYYNYQKAVKKIEKSGYEPATLYELLAFDKKMPDFQRKNPVAAFGHVSRRNNGNGVRLIPCIWGGSSFRNLILRESNPGLLWGNGIYCLGVK